MAEGSLEVKLPTKWTDGKAEVGRVREEKRREEKKKEDQRRERAKRKKMQVHEDVEIAEHCVFPMFWGSVAFSKHVLVQPSCSVMHSFRKELPHAIMFSWSSVCADTSTTPCSPAEAEVTNSLGDTALSPTQKVRPCSDIEWAAP